jgi:hypothetical protein
MKYIKGINEGFEDEFNSKWLNHLFIKYKDEYSELYIIHHSENVETEESDDSESTWFEYVGKRKNGIWCLLTQDFDLQDTYDSYEEIETIHGTPPMSILKSFDVKKFKTFKEIKKLFDVKKEDFKDFEDYFADLTDNGFKLISKEVCFLTIRGEVVNRSSFDNEQVIKFVFQMSDKHLISRIGGIKFKSIDEQKRIFPILNKINNVLNIIGKQIYYNTPNNLIVIVKNI